MCDIVHPQGWRRYLAVATPSARVHLAEVGVNIVKKRRLAFAEANHAAVVWVALAALAEELPAQNIPVADRK